MKPRIRKPLRKGSLVYHGTSSEEEFTDLNGPAWVSDAAAVADFFKSWKFDKGQPRILTFRVREAPRLALIGSDEDLRHLATWAMQTTGLYVYVDAYDEGEDQGYRELAPEGLLEAVCRAGLDGWHIPDNYRDPKGSDTMLCDPERFLEYIETIEVPK